MVDQGFKKLDIYNVAHQLAIEVHAMTLSLPKYELYEEGSQVRRSSKSVPSQIVEGYCLRRHKNEFLLYLNRAYASAEETREHLELLFSTKSLIDERLYRDLSEKYESLCRMIFRFIETVMDKHGKPYYLHEEEPEYSPSNRDGP